MQIVEAGFKMVANEISLRVCIIVGVVFLKSNGLTQSLPTPEALLEKSIAYHDPDDRFMTEAFELQLLETRPNGSNRQTQVSCNILDGIFAARSEIEGSVVEFKVESNRPSVKVNGTSTVPPSLVQRFRATPERALMLRNYYTYLYGLPMKLRDPGTRLPEKVEVSTFQDQHVHALRVTYAEAVGSDVWYFYFDMGTAALVGYRFYHDEEVGDGEYIVLQEEITAGNVRLPKVRKWYINSDARHLGTDTLVSIEFNKQ